ncbi:hypothetical protein D3P07_00770 [Paenibacillus sp. 1011MAR3C5]|nr:hypothetical protein D3P07_00770 [Paenibacillus sp. 1011MAR3C5]
MILWYIAQAKAEDRLIALNIAIVSQSADQQAYERLAKSLQAEFIANPAEKMPEDEFDRSAFEQLRGQVGRR